MAWEKPSIWLRLRARQASPAATALSMSRRSTCCSALSAHFGGKQREVTEIAPVPLPPGLALLLGGAVLVALVGAGGRRRARALVPPG